MTAVARVRRSVPAPASPPALSPAAQPARRSAVADPRPVVDLWALLVWVYRDQRAGRLGLGRGIGSRGRWVDYLVDLDQPGGAAIHPDAGAVHRVVCGLFDGETARLLIAAAEIDEPPARCDVVPRPTPVPNCGRGGRAYAVRGAWIEVAPITLSLAEHQRLTTAGGAGEVSRSAVPGGALRWRYRVDLRRRRPCRAARRTVNADGTPRGRDIGFAEGDHLWSPWCPIEYTPDPAYVAMVNAVFDRFQAALAKLAAALVQVPLHSRRLVGPFQDPRSRPDGCVLKV